MYLALYAELLLLIVVSASLLLLITLLKRINGLGDQLTRTGNKLDQMEERSFNQFMQTDAYLYVRDRLNLRDGIPFTKDWSASPDFLKLIAEHCLDAQPEVIVECSSGVTSLVLARCCELNGRGHLYSLEDGEVYAARSREHIERYGLTAWADILHAPLERQMLGPEEYIWYSIKQLPESPIDMLVIDGPSGFIQKNSRYPALPRLFDKLSERCVVFLDDAARADEQEIIARWQAEFPGLRHEYIRTERGCTRMMIETSP